MKSCFKLSALVLFTLSPMLLCTPAGVHAQWEPDVRLTYNDSTSYTSYNNAWCVAAIADTVHVVWYDRRDGNPEIYTKRSTDSGVSWGADTRLTNNSAYSYAPSVAASGNNVYVVWTDYRDGNNEIYTKRSSDGGASWSLDTRLTFNGAPSWRPSVAASGSNVHVVWCDEPDGNEDIYTKRSTDFGASWGADTRLTNNSANQYYPSVAASGSNVYVVLTDYRDGNNEIYSKRSQNRGSSWDFDIRQTNNSSWSGDPSVAASWGNVHIVWEDTRDGNTEIYTKRSSDGGASWSLDTRLTNNSADSKYPTVAVSGSNVHVIWQDNRDGNDEIYTKRSSDGGTSWSLDTKLTFDGAWSGDPSVAASGNRVHVVWTDNRDGNNEIYYKRDPTGNIGVEEENKGFEGPRAQGFKAMPNPFSSFATLPGHEADRFALYDVSGRLVGTYKGDRIGEGLVPGVYFIKLDGKDQTPVRIVKLR